MCGRFTHLYKWRELQRLMRLTSPPLEFTDRYNVAPSQTAPVVRADGEGRSVAMMQWGLMPPWAGKPGPINARSETVATLPTFRAAFKSRRCVVPASGFYEWQSTGGGKAKQPWYISRADGDPLLLAGLWEHHPQKGDTFTIITTAANEFMSKLHDRMPAILEPESAAAWLETPAETLIRPAADGVLRAHPVSTRVNSPKNEEPGLVLPIADPTTESMGRTAESLFPPGI